MARNVVTAVDLLNNEMTTDFASGSGEDAAINKNIENNDTQYIIPESKARRITSSREH